MFRLNQLVQHVKSGGYYTYLGEATLEATLEPYAMYRAMKDEVIWLRPMKEFTDGRFIAAKETASIRPLATP